MKVTTGSSFKLDIGRCPHCRAKLNGLTPINSPTGPGAGDVTVCAYCATILVFEPDLSLRMPTPEEQEQVGHTETLMALQQAVRKMLAERGKPS